MINKWRKKVKLFFLVWFFTLSARASSQKVAKLNSCCPIIKIESTGPLAQYFPEHLGTFKLFKNSTHVFKHLTNPNSFIYLVTSSKGSSSKWVIGSDYTKKSFIATWSQKQWEIRERSPKPSIFQWKRQRISKKPPVKSGCPLHTIADFQVWDGFEMITDESMQLKCMYDGLERVEIQGMVIYPS